MRKRQPIVHAVMFMAPLATLAFYHQNQHAHQTTVSCSHLQLNKKGSSSTSGGFGTPKQQPPKKKSTQQVLKRLASVYGGTSAQEIAVATQRRVDRARAELPTHLQRATLLYEQIVKWDSQLARLSILQQSKLAAQDMQAAQRAKQELQILLDQHGLTEDDLHIQFQQITWDASADAKAARAMTGSMPAAIAARVDRACQLLATARSNDESRCLDVGCGFGVLVPHLIKAGWNRKQICGVDLSAEMIRNAKEQHVGVDFCAADFCNYKDDSRFDGIIMLAALHDMPNATASLEKAASLLRPNGKLVIAHPQGALHVAKQVASNPVLVKRGLPDANELLALDLGLELVLKPAPAGSAQDADEGYLAVFEKR
jgi:2-polyprenyl-3-methyl-5-hydroxy-6-metoxy-1,4-benzoquinol methylase